MTILDTIVATRKERLDKKRNNMPESALERELDSIRPFFRISNTTLIAECKKGSPSKGVFLSEYDPVSIACQYAQGGANALSVLTEPDHFFGSDEHLIEVRSTVDLPVLRKDFIFDLYQVKESWAIGADAVLLIAAILSPSQLEELACYAHELGLQTLVEVHNEIELEMALPIETEGMGVNARNLKDFSIDLAIAKQLCKSIPTKTVAVAESGLKSVSSGLEMYQAGFRGFLVGEYFITATDRTETVNQFAQALESSQRGAL